MNRTESKYQVDKTRIVIFGAGKVGRSFIGQLFGRAGYKVIFIDRDRSLVEMLNDRKGYRIVIRGSREEEMFINVSGAVHADDRESVDHEISTAGIMAVSVGPAALGIVARSIASGLVCRYGKNPNSPLDIILAENMRSAGNFMREKLKHLLPQGYPFSRLVGLVETSIGKMVPFMTPAELRDDPLLLYAEPYNTLILDKNGFVSPVPEVKGLDPRENIKAWVDRKAFVHNLGHATAAYYGFYRHPEASFMYEVLGDKDVLDFTRNVMLESSDILLSAYPSDFTSEGLESHIDDLLERFRNRELRDTVFRVGHDLTRKLNREDRFLGIVTMAGKLGKPCPKILDAMSFGFFFRAINEEGSTYKPDIDFIERFTKDPSKALISELNMDPVSDSVVIRELIDRYNRLRKG